MIVVSDDECTVIGASGSVVHWLLRADILADNVAKLDPATIPTSLFLPPRYNPTQGPINVCTIERAGLWVFRGSYKCDLSPSPLLRMLQSLVHDSFHGRFS